MPDNLQDLTPEERAAVLLERIGKGKTSPLTPFPEPPKPQYDADLIPDIEPYERSDEDRKLDGFLEHVDVVTAYRTFIHKMEPDVRGKTEGIMISCPMPGHKDSNPSAWINTDKGTWFCGGCQVGGDSYDLAAIDLGYPLDTYKNNGTFPKLRREMAERLGFTIVRGITGGETFLPPEPESAQAPAPVALVGPTGLPLPVTIGEEEPPEEDEVIDLSDFMDAKSTHGDLLSSSDLFIDWETILPTDTFLRAYLEACTIDDLPHEFHIFNGLIALGFAAGTNIYMRDFRPIKSNLFVCLYGRTGVGKSRSIDPLAKLLNDIMPYDASDHYSPPTGTMITAAPVSAEALMDIFKYEILDPSTNAVVDLAQVKGLVRVEELSAFVARASRMGSAMKETLLEMYDVFGGDMAIRGRTSGTTRIRNPFVQMLTTTQPRAIHSFLRRTDTESGFLNRWIMAAGKPRRAPIAYGGVEIDISEAARHLRDVNLWATTPRTYDLTGDALEAWSEFFYRELAQYKSGDEEQDSMVSRVDLTLKKLITLFTVNEMLDQPSAETVGRAIALYPYLCLTYSAFSGDIAFNDVTECQNRIIYVIDSFIQKYNKAPTSNQLRQQIGKKFDLELMIRALKNLVTLDVVVEQAPKAVGRGRPTKRYSLAGA